MSEHKFWKLGASGVVALVFALAGGSALAQPPAAALHTAQSQHFSDGQLQSYAKAAIQVEHIGQKVQASLPTAKTNQARQALFASAEKQQMHAVTANGLTVQQYDAISAAGRKNPQIRAKILADIKKYGGH